MREILFRGKREDTDEWIYGDLLTSTDIVSCTEIAENTGMNDRYEVDPETVGQYTGLTDRNGVKIFEGDIVNVKTTYGSFTNYVITWFNSNLCWVIRSLKDTSVKFLLRSCWELEVVDNIHDNPELLK